MFLNTLGVGEKMVKNWVSAAIKDGCLENSGMKQAMIQEKKKSTSKIKQDISRVKHLREFLERLPKIESHYCRKKTGKLYLEQNFKSKTEVYNLYSCKFSNEFEDLNLALFKPRKDQCDVCSSYKMKQVTEEQYVAHIKAKDLARAEKETDKARAIREEIHCFVVDVQAVKLCPVLQASSLYYKTKLQIHNFTVYNLKNHRSMNFVWNETEAELDSSVFTTCLIKHLEEYLTNEKKNIIVFSDGCGYQNRNVVLANGLSVLASKYDVEIEQKYLERGHTQMECDSTHSLIERKLKNRQIFLPTDYISVINESRKTPTPLEVAYLNHDFFLNYNDPKKFRYSSIRPGKSKGDLKVTDIRALKYLSNGEIFYKVAHDEKYELLPQRKNTVNHNSNYDNLYSNRLKISKKKWHDLQEMKSVLPTDVHYFYDEKLY
ncbi:unnamed protein product [Phaedon cochleariae]|uniref:DUF7869 domain-containing protein n=1 Tax=Phaedon cochleariae TaxID=80249 RepID=A0A9N9X0N7_PHACE|nr:unnamed protein product [Phaedon cochleariae]